LKSRMSLIFTALVVILASMIWVIRDRGNTADIAAAPLVPMLVQTVRAVDVPAPTAVPAIAAAAAPAGATDVTVTPAAPAAAAPQPKSAPVVQVSSDGNVNYTARAGDTVSDLAVALRGSDSKANRDAVIAADPTLQSNPDLVLTGKSYSVVPAQPATAAPTAAPSGAAKGQEAAQAPAAPADAIVQPRSASPRDLRYTAQPGDNVAVLAASLLGGDTKDNRDALIRGNASLQQDPNNLVAGKTYNIETTTGLAAAPDAQPLSAATTQPGADEAARMGVGRVLRYTAQAGDTVSKLATVLLGSDTEANRKAIVANNWSLKQDPDHLVAGKTYWISAPAPAPVADVTTP
jgi:hypothetical protein